MILWDVYKTYDIRRTNLPLVGQGVFIVFGCTITLKRKTWQDFSGRVISPSQRPLTTHKSQTSMPPAGFEPAIPASERPQAHASDRAARDKLYFGLSLSLSLSLSPGATTPIGGCILQPSSGLLASSLARFLDHIRRATVGRTPVNE